MKRNYKIFVLIVSLVLCCTGLCTIAFAWPMEQEKRYHADTYDEYKQLLKEEKIPFGFVKYSDIKELGAFCSFSGSLDFQNYYYDLYSPTEVGNVPISIRIEHASDDMQQLPSEKATTQKCSLDRVIHFPDMRLLDVSGFDPVIPGRDPDAWANPDALFRGPYPYWTYCVQADELVYYYDYEGKLYRIVAYDNDLEISISALGLDGLSGYPTDADTLLCGLLQHNTKDAAMRRIIFNMTGRRTTFLAIIAGVGIVLISVGVVLMVHRQRRKRAVMLAAENPPAPDDPPTPPEL